MQKKLMAVAVAGALGAFAAPVAQAQTSTVQIGGSLNLVYLPSHNPKNPSEGRKGDILAMSEPNMFILGEEKLGGGLTAWFRCESTFDVVSGTATATGFCTRNSGVGLRGPFGNIFAGNWDAPGRDTMNFARGWWGATAPFLGVTGNLILNGAASGVGNPMSATPDATGTTSASFFRRQANSWNYHSPVWNGFRVNAQISAENEATAMSSGGVTLKPRMYSLSAQYRTGPLYLGATYERHRNYNPAGVPIGAGAAQYGGGNDTAWTLAAGYTFGPVSVRGIYTDMDYKVTNTTDLEARGWAIYADWSLAGPHTLRAHYGKLRDTKGTAVNTRVNFFTANAGAGGTGAKTWAAAYSYAFSKRTEGSVVYRHVKNGANTGRFGIGYEAPTTGASQSAIGLNFRHRF